MRRAHFTACLPLLLLANLASGQARAGEWVSYRDVYRAMLVFEKYGGPKNLIQNHLQVAPKDKADGGEALQVTLLGKSMQINLPLDPTGRTVFPQLKAAYDENATLVFSKDGQYAVRPRVSIVLRADGVYDTDELRAACDQALAYARYADASLRSKQCVGVRLVFGKKGGQAGARLRKGDLALPVAEAAAFAGDADGGFPTVTYRFAGAERTQLLASNAPLAIVPLFE